jgi:hypothetical protein
MEGAADDHGKSMRAIETATGNSCTASGVAEATTC